MKLKWNKNFSDCGRFRIIEHAERHGRALEKYVQLLISENANGGPPYRSVTMPDNRKEAKQLAQDIINGNTEYKGSSWCGLPDWVRPVLKNL